MKFKHLFGLILVTGFLLLPLFAFTHEGEHQDGKEQARRDQMIFDEGSGSSSIGEYEERNNNQFRPNQFVDEGSGGQRGMPASTAPQYEIKGGHGAPGYNNSKKKFNGHVEEGSLGKRGFPTN